MGSGGAPSSAFDRGRKAGAAVDGADATNPFVTGSAEHNNFERGRQFGVEDLKERQSYWRERPDTHTPDADETDD